MHRILPAVLAAMFVLPATADGATRYASSASAVTTGACESPAAACKLSYAAQNAAASDEVIVLSDGAYTLDAQLISPATTISGEDGKPRPVIQDTAAQPQEATLEAGQTWRHLELRVPTTVGGSLEDAVVSLQLRPGRDALALVGAPSVRQVSVTATAQTVAESAVSIMGVPANPRLEAMTVHMTGPQAVAIDASDGNLVGRSVTSGRGITAVAAGPGSRGLVAAGSSTVLPGGFPPPCIGPSPHVDLVDSILRGEAADVESSFTGLCEPATSPTRVTLRSSNARADKLVTTGIGVIDSSDPANQLTPALTDGAAIFVDAAGGNLHQRDGAPTIDAGSGIDAAPVDVDGELRVAGSKADIGADESQVANVVGGSATDVTTTSATLGAAVATADGVSTVVFEYGTTTEYGSTSAPASLEARTLQQPGVGVTDLQPATTYHFRAIVTTESQGATRVATGPDRTFTTPAAPPAPPAPPSPAAPPAGGGAGGGAAPGPTAPAFVARGLKAPSSLSLRSFARRGMKVSLQVGVLGSRIAAGLFTGGVTARTAQASRPLVSKTATNTGTVTVTLKASRAALRRLRRLKSITLRVTVTPPAASGAKPVTLTKRVRLKR